VFFRQAARASVQEPTQHDAAAFAKEETMASRIITHSQLDQLLTGLVERVAEVNHAVVLSEDGLVVSRSTGFLRDDAEALLSTPMDRPQTG